MAGVLFCLAFGSFVSLYGAMLVGASKDTYTMSGYAQTGRALGKRLIPVGLLIDVLGLVVLAILLVRGG